MLMREEDGVADRLGCACFRGLIHPIKRRLVGRYAGQQADVMGGGEGEDESQIWSKVKRLDPYQGEHAADLSPLSHIRLLSDFDLCSSNVGGGEKKKKDLALVYLQTTECGTSDCIWQTLF